MIVTTDFTRHHKTLRLVQITGDESSPLCVIELWGHCQNSKRAYFPDMTPSQLALICRWGDRKPACHVALVRCGFVDKLTPKGFTVHDWVEHNRQLIQKWEAGKSGGRPTKSEIAKESAPNEKPTDNRPITDRELDRTDRTEPREQTDKKEQNRTTDAPGHGNTEAESGSGSFASQEDGSVSSSGSVVSVGDVLRSAIKSFVRPLPTLDEIRSHMNTVVRCGSDYAYTWNQKMVEQGWKDNNGSPIKDWKKLAEAWAKACRRRESTQRPDRNAGTYNAGTDISGLKAKVL